MEWGFIYQILIIFSNLIRTGDGKIKNYNELKVFRYDEYNNYYDEDGNPAPDP